MFDLNSDMFKPIIGAKLIRDEAKNQAGLNQLGEVSTEGDINPLLPLKGQEIQNTSLKGGGKERA